MNRLVVLNLTLVVFVGVARVEALVVDPGEAALIVSLSDGSVSLLGNDVSLNGYAVSSWPGSLIPDPERNPSPFATYLMNRPWEITAVMVPGMPGLPFAAGSEVRRLTWHVDTGADLDLKFIYGKPAHPDVSSGEVRYVPTPPEPEIPPFAGFHGLEKPAGSTADNAVVMVHGWQDSPGLFTSDDTPEATNMKGHIEEALADNTQWDVLTYDWSEDAAKTRYELNDLAPSERVKTAAFSHGLHLASEIRANTYDTHLHLIGHGLGGVVIDTAVRSLANDPQWSGTIHATFLDAYTPSFWSEFSGFDATWAEHYYHDDPRLPDTQDDFGQAHNVDITALLDVPETPAENHKWPVRWYDSTIFSDDPVNAGYGFPLAKESSPDSGGWPPDLAAGETVRLPLDGEPGQVIEWAITNLQPVDPGEDLLDTSDTGTVEAGPDYLALETGSPVWSDLDLSTEGATNFLEFDFEFASDADGVLSVSIDGESVGLFHERFVFEGQQSSGKLFFEGPLEAGLHVLGFRLDPLTDASSSVTISGIEAGHLAPVPEPTTLWLLVVAGLCLLGYARRTCRR